MEIVFLILTAVMATVAAALLLLCWYTIRLNSRQRARCRHRADTPPHGINVVAQSAETSR